LRSALEIAVTARVNPATHVSLSRIAQDVCCLRGVRGITWCPEEHIVDG